MESFFIFSYYGNCNTSKQAWYHLREAISFALALGLNREESYSDPSLEVNERRRRLYWLLFITERQDNPPKPATSNMLPTDALGHTAFSTEQRPY